MTEAEDRRREIARQALETNGFPGIDGDPYWLCNLFGRTNPDDMTDMIDDLRWDASILEEAHRRMEEGELLSEEAALYIAEHVRFGEYEIQENLYDSLPIEVEEE
jgi:hypothetical protein